MAMFCRQLIKLFVVLIVLIENKSEGWRKQRQEYGRRQNGYDFFTLRKKEERHRDKKKEIMKGRKKERKK